MQLLDFLELNNSYSSRSVSQNMFEDKRYFINSKESDDGIGEEDIDSSVSRPAPKRRASRAGTRSVASLTPEQLARKRANDREAQRSIRQRTKTHIEDLERRIQDLSGDNEDRNIEDLQRRNSELEEELRHLRELVGKPESTFTSSASSTSSPDLAPMSARYGMETLGDPQIYQCTSQWSTQNQFSGSYSPYPTSRAGDLLSSLVPDYSSINAKYTTPSSGIDSFGGGISMAGMISPTASIVSSNTLRPRGPGMARPKYGRSRSHPNERLGQSSSYQSGFPTLASTRMHGISENSVTSQPIAEAMSPLIMSGIGPTSSMNHPVSPALALGPPAMKMSMNTSLPLSSTIIKPIMMVSNPMIGGGGSGTIGQMSMQADAVTYDLPTRVVEQPSTPTWNMPLRFVAPTCPLDRIYLSLFQRQRSASLEGITGASLIGPTSPSLRSLVNPEQSNMVHPVASVLADLLHRTSLRSLVDRVAAMLMIYSLVQWQIYPTQETYNNIPEWYVPRACQHLTPHPLWMTMIAWGKMRDVAIGNQQRYGNEEFQHIYAESLNLNWPYREVDALFFEGDEIKASEAFRQHVRNLSNWSMDEPFQRAYPELRGTCRFTE